jgi:glycosyltransferase involved in cell wall biosynthesis
MINLIAPINELGYGVVSKNIFRELYKKVPNLKLYPIGPFAPDKDMYQAYLNGKDEISTDNSDLKIWHQNDLAQGISRYYRAGLPFFELDVLTKEEVSHMNSVDLLYLPSKWHKSVAESNGITNPRIDVLPMAVDTSVFVPVQAPYQKFISANNDNIFFDKAPENQPTVFMTCGKWEIRKGHDIIIEAFERAFTPEDNVKLIVNCHNPFIKNNNEWEERYTRRSNQVDLIKDRLATQYHLARLYSMVDCGLFPARAEGWNMEAAELLAMGKRCIMSNYSAHTEYVKEAGAYYFDVDGTEPAHDGVFFDAYKNEWNGNPGKWGKIGEKEIDDIVNTMRSLHKHKSEYGSLPINSSGIKYFQNWTWAKVADKICKDLGDHDY